MDLASQNKEMPPQKSFFSQKAPVVEDKTPQIMEELSGVIRRLKILENNNANLRETLQNLEKSHLDNQKELKAEIRALEKENDELKATVKDLKNTLKLIITELQDAARAEDVKVIQNYLKLWSPVEFVTANQVKNIIKDELREAHNVR